MENNRENFRALINDAAVELSRCSPDIQFEDAQSIIKEFVQYPSISQGHPKIAIGDDNIESIRIDNVPKTLTLFDAAELAAEIHGIATGNLFFAILGGLFLLRSLFNLSRVKLSPVDSLMIMALLDSKRDEGYTEDEWLAQIRLEEKYNIKVSNDFSKHQLIERANDLEKLHAVELVEGKWRFSDKIVFRS